MTETQSPSGGADEALLRSAYRLALSSPDNSTQNGAFLLDRSTGSSLLFATGAWNDLPAGVEYDGYRWERPAKYQYVEHAERACIFKAARLGLRTEGLTMVAAWAACADCARALIGAGIKHLITHNIGGDQRWDESISVGMTMLEEAGVKVTTVTTKLGQCAPVRRSGVLVSP
jgi:deoxycytidylate deaminase